MAIGAPRRLRAGRLILAARGPLAAGTAAPGRTGHLFRTTALTTVLLLSACTDHSPTGGLAADAGRGTIEHVVDGDTVDVRIGDTTERIRLIGVDTPESVARHRPVQCFGKEASDFLATILPVGTEVRLERDSVARDRYDRLLAYVYRADDDLLVNLSLVEQGYADAVTFGDNEALYDVLVRAEGIARVEGRGLWSACGGPDVDIGPPPG